MLLKLQALVNLCTQEQPHTNRIERALLHVQRKALLTQ